ncbi:MAG: phage integrase N-terminal domain-containing protein [Woeseia sp.]
MRDLNYQLKQLGQNNRDGSFATQAKRAWLLSQIANQLHELGFRGMQARSLKAKHVRALVAHWQNQKLAIGTIKNRMSVLRWWARKVNRQSVIANSNDRYGIGRRQLVATTSKAKDVSTDQLAKITDPYVALSLELQRAFGLRREEAIKFQPKFADRGDHLHLKASWTKGGKARVIPIRTDAQRALIDRIHARVGNASLIPAERNYVQQLRIYTRQVMNAGLSKLHGLRHAYAQQRYHELTGWHCPAAGGPPARTLNETQRVIDRSARLTISHELGHEREEITTVYLS